jgi:hypothetical protein
MKANNIKLLLLVVLVAVITFPVHAYDFMVDGIAYNINEDDTTVSVTLNANEYSFPTYSGDIVIPESVIQNGQTYAVTAIGGDAFYNCINLSSVSLPNSLLLIGEYAFSFCSSINSIHLPASVNLIVGNAFAGCEALNSITVDEGNERYDSRNNCNAIIETETNTLITGCSSTIIPSSVRSIGNGAFAYCSNLTSLDIPNSVTNISNDAFERCTSLTSIYSRVLYPASINCSNNAFYGVNMSACTLYIPQGTLSDYQELSPWKFFSNIVELKTGDTNQDGEVTSTDVTVLYNYLLNNDSSNIVSSDVNGDGEVTAADITVVYNILLDGDSGLSRPIITLAGEKTMLVSVGNSFEEPGYSAEINGEDITSNVVVTSNVDTSKPGYYTVTYSVTTLDGLKVTKNRNVWVNNPGHFNTIYWGESWHNTNPQSHYYNSPLVIKENDASQGLYTINDVLGGFYCYGKYPQYTSYNFFVEALLKLDGTSVTMLEEGDWYFIDIDDPLVMLDGCWNPETGVVTYRMNYYASGGVILTPIDETNINGISYDIDNQ